MESINSINLLGHVGRDPELKTVGSSHLCTVNVATSRRFKDSQGEVQTKTTWHRCVAFGKQAETIAKYVKKGDPLYIRGRYESREYEKDGEKRTIFEVAVEEFKFMGNREKDGEAAPRTESTARPTAAPSAAPQHAATSNSTRRDAYGQQTYAADDSDVPF